MRKSKEKVTIRCPNCQRERKRVNWYYRNGGYYCHKRCFKAFMIKLEEVKNETKN